MEILVAVVKLIATNWASNEELLIHNERLFILELTKHPFRYLQLFFIGNISEKLLRSICHSLENTTFKVHSVVMVIQT